MSDREDMLRAARRAVEDNARHSDETLRELLWRWFPEAPDAEVDSVVEEVL